jgi:hypothetical protein
LETLNLPPNLPMWIMITIILLNMFQKPIGEFMVKTFPIMAGKHFAAKDKAEADKREFEQDREAALLREKLAESEANRQRQQEREQQYFQIINRSITFSQETLLKEIDKVSPPIVDEIAGLRRSIDRLAERYEGKNSRTQDKILDHIRGDSR